VEVTAIMSPEMSSIGAGKMTADLMALLENPNSATANAFANFLRLEHSEENIFFWGKCEEYKRLKSHNSLLAKITLQSIVDEYVREGAPRQVNLDSNTRALTMAATGAGALDKAQSCILALMRKDSYLRFLRVWACEDCSGPDAEEAGEDDMSRKDSLAPGPGFFRSLSARITTTRGRVSSRSLDMVPPMYPRLPAALTSHPSLGSRSYSLPCSHPTTDMGDLACVCPSASDSRVEVSHSITPSPMASPKRNKRSSCANKLTKSLRIKPLPKRETVVGGSLNDSSVMTLLRGSSDVCST